MSEEYLVHHGILGMHWGIRRYQNKDGTLTAAGKKRYSTSEESDKPKDVKSMSDEELNRVINRLQKEAQYEALTSKKSKANTDKGKSYVKEFLKQKGKQFASSYVDAAINSFINSKFSKSDSGSKNNQNDYFDPNEYLKNKYLTVDDIINMSTKNRETLLKAVNQVKALKSKDNWSNVYSNKSEAREARKSDIKKASSERRKKLLRMAGVDI